MTETDDDKIPMDSLQRDVNLLDLPPHILEEILFDSCRRKYGRVMTLRAERVCPVFGDACVNLLRSGFRQLETSLKQHVHISRGEMRRQIERSQDCEGQDRCWIQSAKSLSVHLFQLETLQTQLNMIKASVWNYATAELWTFYDGVLLDRFYKVMKQLTAAPTVRGLHSTETVAAMRQVRRESARYLKRFVRKVHRRLDEASRERDEGRNTEGKINAGVIATGLGILEMLECGLEVKRTSLTIAQSASVHSDDAAHEEVPKYTRVKVTYTLNNSWLGILQRKSNQKPAYDEEARQIFIVIRELIWISNMEHLKCQQLKRFGVFFPRASQICSTDHIFINKHTDSSEFPTSTVNVTDNFNNKRLFFYGHRSRVEYSTADSSERFLSPGYDARRQFVFDQRVFDYPTDLVSPRVLVEVDMTCPTDLLPEGLLEGAVHADMPVGERYCMQTTLMSRHAGNVDTFKGYSFTSSELPLPSDAGVGVGEADDGDNEEATFDVCRRWQSGEPYAKINRTV